MRIAAILGGFVTFHIALVAQTASPRPWQPEIPSLVRQKFDDTGSGLSGFVRPQGEIGVEVVEWAMGGLRGGLRNRDSGGAMGWQMRGWNWSRRFE